MCMYINSAMWIIYEQTLWEEMKLELSLLYENDSDLMHFAPTYFMKWFLETITRTLLHKT